MPTQRSQRLIQKRNSARSIKKAKKVRWSVLQDCREVIAEIRSIVTDLGHLVLLILILALGCWDAWRYLCHH